jgi:hypothetical protein
MDNQTIEKRLSELEKEVSELKAEVGKNTAKDWRRTVGRFKDDPGYDEAMRLGAEWRRRENEESIRELELQGMIDADPGHGSPDGSRPKKRSRGKSRKTA